jgi:hypothetical protein
MKMKFENLIEEITRKTGCKAESTGDAESPEYKLTFKTDEDQQRKQELTIAPFSEEGKSFVRLITFVARRQDFTLNKLLSFLELNASLRYGAFALYEDHLAMVSTSKLKNINDQDRIISKIQYLVNMADKFEKTLVGLDRS